MGFLRCAVCSTVKLRRRCRVNWESRLSFLPVGWRQQCCSCIPLRGQRVPMGPLTSQPEPALLDKGGSGTRAVIEAQPARMANMSRGHDSPIAQVAGAGRFLVLHGIMAKYAA